MEDSFFCVVLYIFLSETIFITVHFLREDLYFRVVLHELMHELMVTLSSNYFVMWLEKPLGVRCLECADMCECCLGNILVKRLISQTLSDRPRFLLITGPSVGGSGLCRIL